MGKHGFWSFRGGTRGEGRGSIVFGACVGGAEGSIVRERIWELWWGAAGGALKDASAAMCAGRVRVWRVVGNNRLVTSMYGLGSLREIRGDLRVTRNAHLTSPSKILQKRTFVD